MWRLPRRKSLFWSLSGAFLLVLVIAVVLQWVVASALLEPGLRRWQKSRAQFVAAQTADRIATVLESGGPPAIPPILAEAERAHAPLRVVVRAGAGRWIAAQPLPQGWLRRFAFARAKFLGIDDAPLPVDGRGRGRLRGAARSPGGEIVMVASALVAAPPGREDAPELTVFVAQPEIRLQVLQFLPERTALYLPVAVFVALLAGLFVSHRLQRRLSRLESVAERIGEGQLDARIESPGSDEIGQLAARLNATASRLEQSRDEVLALERQRSQLLADITHDLVTPLTTIRGFAETLLDPKVPSGADERERHLDSILHAARRMDHLLRDLLELSRLEAQAQEFEFEELDLASLARNATARFETVFAEAGLSLLWTGGDVEAWVRADGLRLEQVLDNLLSNARRHVLAGTRVEVDVRAEPVAGLVALEVRDDGPGIEADELEHVFERFYRTDRARSSPGSGLGLAIVREIARRHGGDARAVAREGHGIVFRIEIPAATGEDMLP